MRKTRPPHKQIAKYHMSNSTINETELNFDWSEAETHCWKCGREMSKNLQRCHIIPASLGGSNEPDNFVLLCSRCHSLAPNINNPDVMWEWLKEPGCAKFSLYNSYDTVKALEMYEKEFGNSFFEDAFKQDDFMNRLRDGFKNISVHAGRLNASTLYYLMVSLRK
jgi:hypothetical protein